MGGLVGHCGGVTVAVETGDIIDITIFGAGTWKMSWYSGCVPPPHTPASTPTPPNCANKSEYGTVFGRVAYDLVLRLQPCQNSQTGKIILAFCTLAGGERGIAL